MRSNPITIDYHQALIKFRSTNQRDNQTNNENSEKKAN